MVENQYDEFGVTVLPLWLMVNVLTVCYVSDVERRGKTFMIQSLAEK